ncbi:MAG: DUF2207 domain-containing protein [Bacteroidales bacterium]|nr:DUF2207 domain-containing protein [Bacteroidales bacterium]
MRFWLTLIAAWVSTFAAFADNQRVRDLNVSVALHPSGEATIHETWDVDTGNQITEIYLNRENLGDIEIRDFAVWEEDAAGRHFYNNIGEWDVDRTRQQKAGRCGIVHKRSGVELCWGIGEYGHHTYHATYLMTNAVKSLNDYDMLHLQLVSPGLSAPPENVTVTIGTDGETLGVQLDTTNTRVWGFGFYGSAYFQEDGTVGFASSEPFEHLSSVIVLLRFNKGIFHSPSVMPVDFQEHLDEALEGADFGPQDEGGANYHLPSLKGLRGIIKAIGKVIVFLLAFLGIGGKAYTTGTGRVSKRTKKRLLGMAPEDIPWWRDIPMDGNLIAADYALTRLGEDRKNNALASALILRMIYQGHLDVLKDANGKVEISFNSDSTGQDPEDIVAHKLWQMMLKASGSDQILQENEFSTWSRRNRKRLYDWTQEITTKGRQVFRDKGWMGSSERSFSPEGMVEAQHLLGFKKFLQDFTLTGQREAVEVHLWQEYLVYGALLGVADKVAAQLKDIDPVLFEKTVGYDFDTFTMILYSSNTLARAITVANHAYAASSSIGSGGSWGGFGGGTSFGGGGGFSGGGFGGGGR